MAHFSKPPLHGQRGFGRIRAGWAKSGQVRGMEFCRRFFTNDHAEGDEGIPGFPPSKSILKVSIYPLYAPRFCDCVIVVKQERLSML